MSRRRRPGTPIVAVLVVAVSVLGAGCASIPGSSRPQVINESIPASPPPVDDDPRYDAIVPQPGEQPRDIVRDYLAVGGSFERKHARARAYLTEASARSWDDSAGAVVLETAPYLDVHPDGTAVNMSAQQRGQLTADGAYVPNPAPFSYTFRLEKNADGQWRIANPPGGVFITAVTFEDVYRPYNVYFLDDTRTRVVPDVRWLAAAQDLPSALVTAIQRGPSASLRAGVRSDLGTAKLQSNVIQESDRMRVYLTGLGDQAGPLLPGGFAQLVWTLNQFGVGGVEIYSDGQPLQPRGLGRQPLQRFSDYRVFDPDALSATAPGYFVRNGVVWTTAGSRAPGPAGQGAYGARSVAVSVDQRWMAVVGRGSGGTPTLFVGRTGRPLRAALTGTSLTPPSWGASKVEVWTVRNGNEVVLVPTSGAATPVVVPDMNRIGPVRALRLSRDGARIALVAGPAGRERLYVDAITRKGSATAVNEPHELDVGEGPVTDVSWSGALDLVALVRGGKQDSGLYAVRVDGATGGRLVSTSGLPGPPSAVAAAPALPLLTVAAGSIWRTLASDEPWTRVTRDAAPRSAPAYPG